MRSATEALAEKIPVNRACEVMGYPRSSLYRQRQPPVKEEPPARPTPPRSLSQKERATVLAVLDSERFQDQAPHQVYGALLDEADQLTLHADRGPAMISKTVAQLLIDLNVAKSHSRPYVPDDNPYSEAQFKTMKYRPDYPGRFENLVAAQEWARAFFDWYNNDHRHSGLGLMTPSTVYYGQVAELTAQRRVTLQAAHAAHPERFVNGVPRPPELPQEVWINPPRSAVEGGAVVVVVGAVDMWVTAVSLSTYPQPSEQQIAH